MRSPSDKLVDPLLLHPHCERRLTAGRPSARPLARPALAATGSPIGDLPRPMCEVSRRQWRIGECEGRLQSHEQAS